jgi:hypothetical protein
LHPALIERLESYAISLDDSDSDYVLGQILDQVLPREKAAKPAKQPKAKTTKESPAKAA